MTDWLEVVAKSAVYGLALAAVGAVTVLQLLLPRTGARLTGDARRAVCRDVVRRLRVTAFGLLAAVLLRAWAHTVTAFGFADSFSLANLQIIAVESRWAGGWQLQVGAAVLLCVSAAVAARGSTGAQKLNVPAVLLVCLALPHTGHPAGHPWRELLHAVHVAAGGAWLGTLFITVQTTRAARTVLLHAFAPVAMSAVALVGLAGLAMSVTYIGSVHSLLTSSYGQELLAKVAAVVATLLMGALNWRTLRRGPDAQTGGQPTIEASMVLLIVVLTAWLTETAHP